MNQAEPVPRTGIDFYNELRVTGTLDLGEPVRYGLRHAPAAVREMYDPGEELDPFDDPETREKLEVSRELRRLQAKDEVLLSASLLL